MDMANIVVFLMFVHISEKRQQHLSYLNDEGSINLLMISIKFRVKHTICNSLYVIFKYIKAYIYIGYLYNMYFGEYIMGIFQGFMMDRIVKTNRKVGWNRAGMSIVPLDRRWDMSLGRPEAYHHRVDPQSRHFNPCPNPRPSLSARPSCPSTAGSYTADFHPDDLD